jgi:uncharacterized protein (TIGR02680 family)
VSEAEKEMVAAADDTERLRQAKLACDEDREIAEERQRAVLVSPAYRDAKSLGEIEERLVDDVAQLERAEHRLTEAEIHRDEAVAAREQADHVLKQVSAEADRAFTTVAEAADLAGVPWTLGRDEVTRPDLARFVRDLGARRRQDISEVRGALAQAEHAAAQAEATRTAEALATHDAQQADDRRQEAAEALDRARSELADALRQWALDSEIPELGPAVEVAAAVGDAGSPSLADFVTEALRPRRDDLTARQARAEDLAESLSGQRAELVAERQRVADDPIPAPDRLPTRPADRSARAGAPLYACCDFVETVPQADRAGLEAAIEAAGLLDAWVGPATGDADVADDTAGAGSLHRLGEDLGELDAWLRAGPPQPGPSLADVLVPTPPDGSGLEAGTVRDVLMSISLAEAGVLVRPDGTFVLGPLSGRFAKPAPDFIGATAREQRRRRLLAELDERIAELSARLAQLADELSGMAAEQRRLDAVSASVPSVAEAISARDALMRAVANASTSRQIAARAGSVAREALRRAEERTADLRALAASRRLPTDADGLQHADGLVHSYLQHAGDLVGAVRSLAERRADQAALAQRVARADQQLAGRRTERDDLHRHVRGLQARVDQLRSQLGADADAPLRELAAIQEQLRRLRGVAEDLARQADAAAEHRGRAHQETEAARAEVDGRETSATASAARLEVLRRKDIWSVVVGGPATPEAPVELAGVVVAATADVNVEADDNSLQRGYRQLLDELGRGYDPSLSYVDHVAVVEVTSDAGTFSVLWLAQELADHVSRQQALLSDRDREIFERHLLTRVSEALRELLNDAYDLVQLMNKELACRPTASGKTVQLRWELDSADPAVRDALGLLRKTPELLGPAEREQLRRFFSTAIAQRRAEDAASGYAEILRHVLDYRSWHVFTPHVRSAGGGTQRLTKTLFQSLSGGEQAVVLHLPLFAAAAAHYNAATEMAPRLIALDEAFAGIDEGMRAELMGLLVRFDLDILLTGHELWGAYGQVPALMVYDLLRHPPLEGVSALAARWDGVAMAEA